MEGKFGMEGIPETENFTERIGTEAGARWSDVLYKGILLYKLCSMKIWISIKIVANPAKSRPWDKLLL